MNIGERIGDYEIVEVLGSGGMGQVYKVRNTLSERTEAMKVLLPNLESDPDLGDRFLREIKVQAALDHPNIAKFHSAMRVGNQLLMFMEFVDGVSLAKEMERGPIAAEQAAAIATQVLDALSYAHARGVVHRDIKPANIMLTTGGVVKLMDFGIARMQSDKRLTQTGAAVGSLFYMSPEQIRGAEPDPRSDLYSLGVTLYEVITGRRPFGGNSDYQIMSAHMQESPRPPIEIVPGVSPDLSEIILTAIAKDPAARFQSAAAFRAALASVFPGVPAAIQITGAQVLPPPPPMPVPVGPPPAPQVPPPVFAGPPPVFAGPPPVFAGAPPVFAGPPPVFAGPPAPVPVPTVLPPAPPPVPRPQPVYSQPAYSQPVPAPVVVAKSNRTLYMAVGSVATLALLIAAGIEGPKLMHGGSSAASGAGSGTATETSAPAASGTAAPGAADQNAPAASTDPASSPAPASASTPATSPASSANAQPASSSAWKPVGQAPVASSSASPSTSSSTSSQPAAVNAAPAAQTFQQQAAPVQQQAQPQQAQTPAAPAPAAQNREAAQLRQQYNELTIRANSAASGLQSFQQQQSRQGLGLRADIREAKTRLDYQLQEASTAVQNGDAEAARQAMRYAQSAIDTIDKFLGR